MKRSHTIKIEDLQNPLLEGSIEEISQEQAKKINGGVCCLACPPEEDESWPPKPPL
ncbi:MAG: hypothetical protein RLZZ381_1408 [Cyanobacteriota bacterium]|jgi:hypothetical protein